VAQLHSTRSTCLTRVHICAAFNIAASANAAAAAAGVVEDDVGDDEVREAINYKRMALRLYDARALPCNGV